VTQELNNGVGSRNDLNSDGSLGVSQDLSKPPQTSEWGANQCLSEVEWGKFRKYLADRPLESGRITLSIAEIERIIDRRLPADAGLPSWWTQCPGLGEREQGSTWRVAGMPGHYLIELVRN
jgi:hypothetical protein